MINFAIWLIIPIFYTIFEETKFYSYDNRKNTRKAVHLTMVTTYGVRQNSHSGIIQSEVTLEDLFT